MSKLSPPLRAVSATLARTFGKTVTVTYVTGATYSTTTGKMTPTTSTADIKAVVESYEDHEIGGLIEAGDVKVTIAQQGNTEPKVDDTLTISSVVYEIITVEHTDAGTDAVLFTMQVRR